MQRDLINNVEYQDPTDKYIYVLKHNDEHEKEVIFYVGQSKDPKNREKTHIYSSKSGHEDKYVYIRNLEKEGCEWWIEPVIKIDTERGLPQDHERFYVIYYARLGFPLTNMKHGDINTAEEIQAQITDTSIQSIEDVRDARIRAEDLRKSAAFVNKAGQAELQFDTKPKRKTVPANRIRNLDMVRDLLGREVFDSYIDKGDLRGYNRNSPYSRNKWGWNTRVEQRLGLPKGWLDVDNDRVPITAMVEMLLNKKDVFEKNKNFYEGYRTVFRWMLIIFHGGSLEDDALKQYNDLRYLTKACWTRIKNDSNRFRNLQQLPDKYKAMICESVELRDKYRANVKTYSYRPTLPVETTGETGYAELAAGLSKVEYNRKMCLLWFCLINDGIGLFSGRIGKNPSQISPYLIFGASKPITAEIARAFERHENLPADSLDLDRDFLLINPPT